MEWFEDKSLIPRNGEQVLTAFWYRDVLGDGNDPHWQFNVLRWVDGFWRLDNGGKHNDLAIHMWALIDQPPKR
jgi:hypothetical protein